MYTEAILGILLLLLWWKAFLKKPADLPPGRWGLPLVGYIPFTKKSMEEQLLDLNKEHGDIYVWRMGTQVMVFLHSYEMCKEALGRQDFVNRPDWQFFTFGEKVALGVGGSNGSLWHSNRRFTLRQLKDQGMGKSRLVSSVHEQTKMLLGNVRQQVGKSGPVPHAIRVAVVNVIWHMVAGITYDVDDAKLKGFLQLMDNFNDYSFYTTILDMFPWLGHLPLSLKNRLFYLDQEEIFKERFMEYFYELIEEHRSSMDPENPRDLMDAYLMEMREAPEREEVARSEKDLAILILDLFFAGSETTTSTLTFIMYYLAVFPEAQRKLQQEIDRVLPDGALATLEDKARLPYTEAVIHEVLRMSSLVPGGVQHCASKDTQFAGYTIPKGSIINYAIASVHYDPRYWKQPEKFMPERWLDAEGKFNTKKEGFLPFGVGKRVCLGESLARMELLIFTAAVFQNFNISSPPGSPLDITPDPKQPMFHLPRNQNIYITARN
ncbi:cytochrome P450 2L1-like [Penaeus japonicus]|uniref:cytochrome P450 2L1-like n=1 Tax=Penaeus japonicus TaxID=27405 RepID=UPI001C712A3C|nr:cytochrome P450 2L1-like [Penaeus japonicus]XP_042884302.1 cytochrome P450 2L1-like [Penaeus japonicus]